jgi:hypothetical protein
MPGPEEVRPERLELAFEIADPSRIAHDLGRVTYLYACRYALQAFRLVAVQRVGMTLRKRRKNTQLLEIS